MKRGAVTSALALVTLIGSFSILPEGAAAQSIEARPGLVSVPASRSASVPVTWEISNQDSLGPIASITSPSAQLFAPGIGPNNQLELAAPLTHGPLDLDRTARIRERMVIPQAALMGVLQAGSRTIGVERMFFVVFQNGQSAALEGSLEIQITGSLGAEVQISRIDLRFQNEAVQIIVPQNHPPEVRADISYTGTGLFRAVWELADPRVTAAGGNPVFRVLRQERVRLGVGGFTRIKGPGLPADLTGLHIVRFRVLDGPLAGEATVVRYFVKAAAPDEEDWWKRYIRPHTEGEGLVRIPAEPEEGEVTVEETAEPEGPAPPDEDAGSPGNEEPPGEEDADTGSPDEESPEEEAGTDEPEGEAPEADGESEG